MLLVQMFGTHLLKGCGIYMLCSARRLICNIMHRWPLVPRSFVFLKGLILLRNIQAEQRGIS